MKLYNCRIQWNYHKFISSEDQDDNDMGKQPSMNLDFMSFFDSGDVLKLRKFKKKILNFKILKYFCIICFYVKEYEKKVKDQYLNEDMFAYFWGNWAIFPI